MRYWAYLAAKLVALLATFCGSLALLNWLWPAEPRFFTYVPPRFGYSLGYTLVVLVLFLLSSVGLHFVVLDQRYRCRVCLRRLRMPVKIGSWGRMLQFGRPQIEYICPYGHGTLHEDELQICGRENPHWTPHSTDMWEELYAASKATDDEK